VPHIVGAAGLSGVTTSHYAWCAAWRRRDDEGARVVQRVEPDAVAQGDLMRELAAPAVFYFAIPSRRPNWSGWRNGK
jgi:hypothetical protein